MTAEARPRRSCDGTVDYIEQSEACSDIAQRIKGVRVLENHLHVAETGEPARAR